MRQHLALVGMFVIAGCSDRAMGARDAGAESHRRRAVEHEVEAPADERGYGAPTIVLASPIEQGTTMSIGPAPSPGPARPPARGNIDVDLKAAAIGDALRFIADAGGFNLVVEGDASTPVTVRLRGVEAYDALLTVAEAHGLEVGFERGIVIVSPPKSHAAMGLAKSDIR